MLLKSIKDPQRQPSVYPEPRFGLNLAVKSRKFVPNPSFVSFFIVEIKTLDARKEVSAVALTPFWSAGTETGVSNPSLT